MNRNKLNKTLGIFFIILFALYGMFRLIEIYQVHLQGAPGWTWTKLAFFTFLFAALCIVLFFGALKSSIIRKNFLTSNIHSSIQGKAQISGEVANLNDTVIQAPFSNRDCCWYQYEISYTEKVNDHYNDVTIFSSQNANMLKVKDDSGYCVFNIDASANLWKPAATYEKDYAKLSDIKNETMQAILPKLIQDNGDIACRLKERIIAPSETLYLSGSFRTIEKNEVASTLLLKQTNKLSQVVKSNVSEANAALQLQQINSLADNRIHVMLSTSSQDKIFLTVSNKTNKQRSAIAMITAIVSLLLFIITGIFFIYLFIDPMAIIQKL